MVLLKYQTNLQPIFPKRGRGGQGPRLKGCLKNHPFLLREVVRQAKAHNHQFPTMLLHWLQIPKSENSQVKIVSIKEGYLAGHSLKRQCVWFGKNLDCNLSP